jgi:ABC-2 type transport system permease protein
MKRLFMMVSKELKLLLRDKISFFMVLAPVLLSAAMMMLLTDVGKSEITLAVTADTPVEIAQHISAVAQVELVADYDALERRVRASDSVGGIFYENGETKILIEGNEIEGFGEGVRLLVSAALGEQTITVASEEVTAQDDFARNIALASVILLALFVGGASLGFNGVYEREDKTIHALAVSPSTLWHYALSKMIPALLITLINMGLCALIIGKAETLGGLLLITLCSVLMYGLLTFILISLADNQVAAIGVIKGVMPLFLVIGISSAFVPQAWHFFYYIFPMYWQYTAIDAVLTGKAALWAMLLTFVTSIPWLVLFLVRFKKKAWIRG